MTTKKYPISINGKQCIGPCYFADTISHHPIELEEISFDKNYCPVDKFVQTINGKNSISNIDICDFPTVGQGQIIDDHDLLFPITNFDSEFFIKIYYKLNSLEDVINWLDTNKISPITTRIRVFDNGIATYGDDLGIFDHRLVQFVNELMVKNLKKFYAKLHDYIIIKNDTITIIEHAHGTTDTNTKDDKKIIMLFIKEKFLGIDNVHHFLSKFIRYYKDELKIKHISNMLVEHMIDYIIKRITTN